MARQSQKLQKALFDSVSHELKTPLAAMSAALQQQQSDRAELQQAARRLTRTVDHLLDATRLESGLLQPVREWCEPADLLREAVAAAGLNDNDVRINIAKNLPTISYDFRLIQQALGALLSNAVGMASCQSISARRATIQCLLFPLPIMGPVLPLAKRTRYLKNFIAVRARAQAGLAWDFRSRVN